MAGSYVPKALYFQSPLYSSSTYVLFQYGVNFLWSYIATVLSSQGHMFPETYVPKTQSYQGSFVLQFYICGFPGSLYVPGVHFPKFSSS